MKIKHLFYMLLALPMAFVACGENPNAAEPELALTSQSSFQFDAEGGEGTISYTLKNATLKELTVSCEAEWIEVTKGEAITFVVAPNESEDERNGRILVSCGTKSFNVFVVQNGKEEVVRFTADQLVGVYYGTQYSETYNISLYLTDIGFEDGYALAGGTYYMLDLFTATEPSLDEEGWMTIPEGTYTFDGTDSTEDMTLGYTYSAFFKIMDDGSAYEAQANYEAAELVVTANSITLTAYVNGVKHIATYNGGNKFFAGLPLELPGGDIVATSLVGDYYGTQYSTTYNYNIYLSDKGYDNEGYALPDGYYVSLDLYGLEPTMDAQGYINIPVGTYNYDVNDDCGEWEVGSEYSGFYKVNAEGSDYEFTEAFTDVTVVVTDNGITVDCVVAGGEYHITYNGAPKFYAGAYTYAASSSKMNFGKKGVMLK